MNPVIENNQGHLNALNSVKQAERLLQQFDRARDNGDLENVVLTLDFRSLANRVAAVGMDSLEGGRDWRLWIWTANLFRLPLEGPPSRKPV